jgi:hypothetical protein
MSGKEPSSPRKRAFVGIYREGIESQGALVMSEEAFERIIGHNAVASATQGAGCWEDLFEGFDRKEVERVLSAVIGDVQHLAASDDDLPPIEALTESDMWSCAFQPFDDSRLILDDLPDQIRSLAHFPAVSVMTDYEPCCWDPDDLPAIRKILEAAGWEIVDTDFHPAWP